VAEINLLAKYPRAKRNLIARKGKRKIELLRADLGANISMGRESRATAATATTAAGSRSHAMLPRISGLNQGTEFWTLGVPRAFSCAI
jgi:hypothetical protein